MVSHEGEVALTMLLSGSPIWKFLLLINVTVHSGTHSTTVNSFFERMGTKRAKSATRKPEALKTLCAPDRIRTCAHGLGNHCSIP